MFGFRVPDVCLCLKRGGVSQGTLGPLPWWRPLVLVAPGPGPGCLSIKSLYRGVQLVQESLFWTDWFLKHLVGHRIAITVPYKSPRYHSKPCSNSFHVLVTWLQGRHTMA